MGKFFKELEKSFKEIIAYRKGKITLRSEYIKVPEPLEKDTAKKNKKKLRKKNHSS